MKQVFGETDWSSIVQLLADPESMIAMIDEQRRGLIKAVNIEEYGENLSELMPA